MKEGLTRSLLKLVRLGIGHPAGNLSESVDLAAVKALAAKQGLSAVVLDGLNEGGSKRSEVRCNSLQEKILLAQWIGEVHQFYEQRYEQYVHAISSLAAFYNSHGYKMMVLKGYACSLDWPKPNHRPCGDIDIWLFGQQKEADKTLESSEFRVESVETVERVKKIKIDRSHHHHTVFTWNDFMVENHYDFINVHHHKSHVEFEAILKELGQDDSHFVEIESTSTGSATKVYLPTPNLHALFLLKHLTLHFSTSEINLRQLLDWAFFVQAHGKDVDWERVESVIEQFGMKDIYGIFNAICVEELGFESDIFNYVQFNPQLKDRVLSDILEPAFGAESPKSLIPRIIYKYKRWWGNGWKHDICYRESRWESFWTLLWSHLIKPKGFNS